MKVLILGGDGYLGWASAMHLSARGHEVTVVDNYLRRRLAREIDREALIAVPNLQQRGEIWRAGGGRSTPSTDTQQSNTCAACDWRAGAALHNGRCARSCVPRARWVGHLKVIVVFQVRPVPTPCQWK